MGMCIWVCPFDHDVRGHAHRMAGCRCPIVGKRRCLSRPVAPLCALAMAGSGFLLGCVRSAGARHSMVHKHQGRDDTHAAFGPHDRISNLLPTESSHVLDVLLFWIDRNRISDANATLLGFRVARFAGDDQCGMRFLCVETWHWGARRSESI